MQCWGSYVEIYFHNVTSYANCVNALEPRTDHGSIYIDEPRNRSQSSKGERHPMLFKNHGSLLLHMLVVLILIVSAIPVASAPGIFNVTPTSTTVGLYDKFETTFNVGTVATNPYWPYDESPNTSVPARVGVSVDGLFSNDNWQTTIVQPGFYGQEYETSKDSTGVYRTLTNGKTWVYPTGTPVWRIRFAPPKLGTWQYKIRVTDASGTTTSSTAFSFNCVSSQNHGFVKVSPTDKRYFELSDGTFVPMLGISYDTGSLADIEDKYAQLSEMGVNLVRTWWQSSNPKMALFGSGGQGGDGVWNGLDWSNDYVRSGKIAVAKLTKDNPKLYQSVAVKPNTSYKLSAWIKTVGITGTGSYGVRVQAWPAGIAPLITGTNDWNEVVVDVQTLGPTQGTGSYELPWVEVKLENVTGGQVYISDMSLREVLSGGQLGPELLIRPDLIPTTSYAQPIAWTIDKLLDTATKDNVYVKAVIQEKGDSYFTRLQADGTWGAMSTDNVYASATHPSRTYQQYFWRYIIARWGYSTALHSIEMFNEADPFSGNHYSAAAAMGSFFKQNDPSKHLVSTSNWHSFPPAMWTNPDLHYSDIHMYLGWNVASGGNRLWPGWDGSWTQPSQLEMSQVGDGFAIDNTTAHSGTRSLKMTLPVTSDAGFPAQANVKFQCGVPSGHQIRVSAWVKAQNCLGWDIEPWSKTWQKSGLYLVYSAGGGDFYGYPTSGDLKSPTGTYDWQKVEATFTVPTVPQKALLLEVTPRSWQNNINRTSQPGYLWIDDILVEDLTSGLTLNYNGGWDYEEGESYDIVNGHVAYSRLARSFQYDKPAVRGELGICAPMRYTDPYQGFGYTGEDQYLVNDSNGVWWHKLSWSNIDSGGLYEIYWWYQLPLARNFKDGAAFQRFMAGIPLSNGNYREIDATSTSPLLRVLGQKDTVNNMAHLWIDNIKHTWKNVIDGVSVPAVTGSVTVSGFKDGAYKAEWWDTTNGVATRTDNVTCSGGKITLAVQNLQTDTAVKIMPAVSTSPAAIGLKVITPSSTVKSGETVTITVQFSNTGASSATNVQVSADVPAEMDYITGSAEATGGAWSPTTRQVSWTVGSVAAGATGSRTFQAKVK